MQLILKGVTTHVAVDLKDHKQALNIKWLCGLLGINYSSLTTCVNRDGMTIDQAIAHLSKGGMNA